MARRTIFVPYRPKTILNKAKRADHWFWTRYSAYPYIGCQHGCEFCYCRESKYSPYEDIDDFAHIIKVKENAPDLLRRALSRASRDVIFTGDYQPAEKKYRLSRKMLEVCCELGFPVFVLERSPLVLRDLDLLQEIHKKAHTVVAFSIISTPESANARKIRRLERLAPLPEKRFDAMCQLAAAGIPTGVCMMPILPGLCDNPENLEAMVRWTADNGGQFILASSLTLADQQRMHFFSFLKEHQPDMLSLYNSLYPPGSYSPKRYNWREIGLRIREHCNRYGIRDRMPRPIIPGEKRALNRKVVEMLVDQVYSMELNAAPDHSIWAFRKAAWAVEDLEQDINLVYQTMGLKGLQSIPDVGVSLGAKVERILLAASIARDPG